MKPTESRQLFAEARQLFEDVRKLHSPDPKPCPFCGSRRIVKGERYFAMCVDCGATGPERSADATQRKFMGDWNTRAES